jgi:cold shock CspA family protein
VQGTIKSFDAATRTGSLLTDASDEIVIDEQSADPDVLLLRIGQRVRFTVESTDAGTVARDVHLVTF